MTNKTRTFILLIPLLITVIWLYYTPFYLTVMEGDPNYHLPRAREIMESPTRGIFWDNFRCYPQGKAVNHQPLYHLITAMFWYLGGVKFSFSIMAIIQIIMTVGVASFFSKKFGTVAGFTSGLLAFFTLRADTLLVPTPSAFLFPLILLTIYFASEKVEFSYVFFIAALWLHPGVLFVFPVIYYFFNLEKGNKLLNSILFFSWVFWASYWLYFGLLKGQMGQSPLFFNINAAISSLIGSLLLSITNRYFTIIALGIYGFYLTREIREMRIVLICTIIIVMYTLIYGDYFRYPQFVIMPLAISSGIVMQSAYNALNDTVKNKTFAILSISILILILFLNVPNVIKLTYEEPPMERDFASWAGFEFPNMELKNYIEKNTDKSEIVYADDELVDKIVWMTGRKVSNCGVFGSPEGFIPQTQRLNLKNIPVLGDKVLFRPIIIDEELDISVDQMYEIYNNNPQAKTGEVFTITRDMKK